MRFNKEGIFRFITQVVVVLSISVYGATAFSAPPSWLAPIISDCDSGVTQECLNAGIAYSRGEHNGKKVAKDKAKSKLYIDKAVNKGEQNCLQGDSQDCYTLGILFFEGGGVIPTNIPRGLDFLQRSCRAGRKEACAWLDNSGL